MFFKNIDLISPNLTLFYKGYLSHSNIFSGIITIIVYLISIFSIIYFSLDIICRLNPTVYFYNKTIIDSGNFLLNSDSIFHYVSIYILINQILFYMIIIFMNLVQNLLKIGRKKICNL